MRKNPPPEALPFLQESAEGCTLKVSLHPRSTHERIVGLQGGCLKIGVNAPPAEGRANEACLRLLAHQLGVKRSQLTIRHGHRSPQKLILIRAFSLSVLQDRLASLLNGKGEERLRAQCRPRNPRPALAGKDSRQAAPSS